MPRNPPPRKTNQIYPLKPPRLQQLLKINFQNFVFCLRCHFIRVNSKVQRCKGESAKLHRHRRDSIIAPSHLCALHILHTHTYATLHSPIFALKANVQSLKWPHRNIIRWSKTLLVNLLYIHSLSPFLLRFLSPKQKSHTSLFNPLTCVILFTNAIRGMTTFQV